MKKNQFLANSEVNNFVSWLVANLPTLPINLRIGKSRFVPNGVNEDLIGFDKVLKHYIWNSTGTSGGSWTGTKSCLTGLSNALRTAVAKNDDGGTFKACEDILAWGGDRNSKVGAYPFLERKKNTNTLCEYIRTTGNSFLLTSADDSSIAPPVTRMNAMLTKVHALYATDGLPIYDSRVAAAIASLVELWRQSTAHGNLTPELTFPATLTTRTVLRLFPNAIPPGVMPYGASSAAATAKQWSSAKVRLGWIMEEVLTNSPTLFPSSFADRMHAFEASLFMIGYDPACLNPHATTSGAGSSASTVVPAYAKAMRTIRKGMMAGFALLPKMSCATLVQNKLFEYSGNLEDGFVIWYPSGPVLIELGFIEEIQNAFGGYHPVLFGFDMTGKKAPIGSFGRWIGEQSSQYGRKLTGRHASHIAALLVNEGLAEKIKKTIRVF